VDGKKEEIRFITPDWVKSPPPVMEVGQLGSKIILGLHSLMREAQTHGTDSVALDEPISQYLHFINPFILSEGGIALEIAEDGFLLNNRKIRPKSGDHAVFKSFMKSLIGRRIGKLEIQNPLDEKELKEFVFHLIALEEGDEDNALYLMRRLDARKIDSISASRLELKEEPVPKTAEGRRRARELYFAAIGIVQEIMEGAGEGRALNMRRAKRLMQELVASFVQDEFTLLGLAMIKAYGQYLYNHSVNVAIYSIALGLRLGLPHLPRHRKDQNPAVGSGQIGPADGRGGGSHPTTPHLWRGGHCSDQRVERNHGEDDRRGFRAPHQKGSGGISEVDRQAATHPVRKDNSHWRFL